MKLPAILARPVAVLHPRSPPIRRCATSSRRATNVAAVVPRVGGACVTRGRSCSRIDAKHAFADACRGGPRRRRVGGGRERGSCEINVVASTQDMADEAQEQSISRASATPADVVVVRLHCRTGARSGIDAGRAGHQEVAPRPQLAAERVPCGPRFTSPAKPRKARPPAEAAAKTIASLVKTLESLGVEQERRRAGQVLPHADVGAAPDVMEEFEKVFGERSSPLVFVEWKSDLPIEIELIAAAPTRGSGRAGDRVPHAAGDEAVAAVRPRGAASTAAT